MTRFIVYSKNKNKGMVSAVRILKNVRVTNKFKRVMRNSFSSGGFGKTAKVVSAKGHTSAVKKFLGKRFQISGKLRIKKRR